MESFVFAVDRAKPEPLYAQLTGAVRRAVAAGQLPAGAQLPSIRALSARLEVSKTTVESAYAQLLAEGYIASRPGSGYTVSPLGAVPPLHPSGSAGPAAVPASPVRYDFAASAVDASLFDRRLWKRYLGRALETQAAMTSYGDSQGEPALRRALCEYTRRSRGAVCTPESLVVGAGVQSLLQIFCTLLGRDGRPIGVEHPGFLQAEQVFFDHGFPAEPFSLEKLLARRESPYPAIYLNPSSPYRGRPLAAGEKLRLLTWCQQTGTYLLEDDYNGEFRYAKQPVPALQGLAENDRVVYLGSFSRLLLPSIRISYMALPQPLLARYLPLKGRYNPSCSTLEQLALAGLIADGHLARQIGRMRRLYAEKSRLLRQCLAASFGPLCRPGSFASALQLTARLELEESAASLCRRALAAGVKLRPVPPLTPGERPQVLFSISAIPREEIAPAVEALRACWLP